MKSSALFAVAIWATSASAQIHFPFSRQQPQQRNGATARSTTKNDNDSSAKGRRTIPLELFQAQYTYVVNASVGTPPQNVSLSLTVSAEESWVLEADEYDSVGLWGYGAFAPANSSTFVRPGNNSFTVRYTDGTYAYGDRIHETMWVGGAALPDLTMGLARSTNTRMGVLALGFNDSHSDVPNVPDRMLAEGLISSTAFSIWLDDASAASGNVLFGAVDRAAFEPPLVRFPIADSAPSSAYSSLYSSQNWGAKLSSLNYTRSAGGALQPLVQNQTAVQELLMSVDPSFSVSTLPLFLAQPIWDLAGARYDGYEELTLVPCAAASNLTSRLALQLYGPDGPVIDMPVSDLVLDSNWVDYDPETDEKRCVFGVQNATDTVTSSFLGDTDEVWSIGAPMLKRAYAVFDIANKEMGFASVKFGAGEEDEDVVAFSSYGAKIPESTLAAELCDERYNYCPDDSDSTSHRTSSSSYDHGLSGGPLVGVVVGCIVAGTIVTLGIIWAIMSCARRRQLAKMGAIDNEKGQVEVEPEQAPPLPPRPSAPSGVETGEASQTNAARPEPSQANAEVGEPSQVTTEKAKAPEPDAEKGESSQANPETAETSQVGVENAKGSQAEKELTETSQPQAEKGGSSQTDAGKTASSS